MECAFCFDSRNPFQITYTLFTHVFAVSLFTSGGTDCLYSHCTSSSAVNYHLSRHVTIAFDGWKIYDRCADFALIKNMLTFYMSILYGNYKHMISNIYPIHCIY